MKQIRCASASSSGFPDNSGLQFDQINVNVVVEDLLGLELVAAVVAVAVDFVVSSVVVGFVAVDFVVVIGQVQAPLHLYLPFLFS